MIHTPPPPDPGFPAKLEGGDPRAMHVHGPVVWCGAAGREGARAPQEAAAALRPAEQGHRSAPSLWGQLVGGASNVWFVDASDETKEAPGSSPFPPPPSPRAPKLSVIQSLCSQGVAYNHQAEHPIISIQWSNVIISWVTSHALFPPLNVC